MPETTPKTKPKPRFSQPLRNRLPCPHSCINTKARSRNRLVSSMIATVSAYDTSVLSHAA